jgi:hypothetical protein
MPNIRWNRTVATTASDKAAAGGNMFFPQVDADLTDIIDCEFAGTLAIERYIDRIATKWEVYSALRRAKLDKCLGIDEIPNRFLHAMGEPLVWWGSVVPYKITWYGLQLFHSGILVYSVGFAVS